MKNNARGKLFFTKNSQKFCTEYDCKDRVWPTYFLIAVVLTLGGVLMNQAVPFVLSQILFHFTNGKQLSLNLNRVCVTLFFWVIKFRTRLKVSGTRAIFSWEDIDFFKCQIQICKSSSNISHTWSKSGAPSCETILSLSCEVA